MKNFTCVFNDKVTDGEFVFYEDGSLIFTGAKADYALLPAGNWRFELMLDSLSGKCICLWCSLQELKCIKVNLTLPSCKKGELFYCSEEKLLPGCGSHYFPFEDAVYFDEDKRILCFGAKDSMGEVIEFANDTLAVIDNGKLSAIFVNLNKAKVR